jgi:hypothetical protein
MVYYMAENLNWLGSVGHSFFGKYTNGEQLVKLICYGWFGSIALNIVKHLLMVPPPPSLPPSHLLSRVHSLWYYQPYSSLFETS